MKYIILIIVYLFSPSSLQAQKFQSLYNTEAEEIMHSARLLSNGNILAVHSANMFNVENSQYNYFGTFTLDTLNYLGIDIATAIQSEVLIFDADLNTLKDFRLNSNNDTIQIALHAIEDTARNEIDILVGYITDDIVGRYILISFS